MRRIGTIAALKVQIYDHISGHTIVSAAAATDEGFARFQLNAERELRSFKQSDNRGEGQIEEKDEFRKICP